MTQKIGPKELALKSQREDIAKHHKMMIADGSPPKLVRTGSGPKLVKKSPEVGVTLAPPLAVQKAIAADLADEPPPIPVADLHKSDNPTAQANAESWNQIPTIAKAGKKPNPPKIKQVGVVPLAELAKMVPPTPEATPKAEPKESVMRTSKQKKTATAKARKPVNGAGKTSAKGTKLELIASMLKRKEGCTAADAMKAVGWTKISMPAQAKAAGLKLKKEKDGKVTRYRAA